ncbi:MAG: ferredoxin [Chloroflexota bacterium]|nr:ferredoxin [Chloroflexota bacterium]
MTADTVLFRLTGTRSDLRTPRPDAAHLRPALFARMRDLARLRYDHPALLVDAAADGSFVRPLSSVVDEALREVAPKGIAGERMRRMSLRCEREIRAACAAGQRGTLSDLWERAAERLSVAVGADAAGDLARVRAAMRTDGEVVDCDGRSAGRIVEHAWRAAAEKKAAALRRTIDALIVRLGGLVAADLARSDAGRDAAHLRAAVGAPHRELFDFDAMARLVAGPSRGLALPAERRERISRILGALRSHRALAEDLGAYEFESADAALAAFRKRLPAMAELVAAIAMGDLEVEGKYVGSEHDDFFRAFDESALRPEDLGLFPDPLVRLAGGVVDAPFHAAVMATLTAGAPLKVLVETDDLFGMGPRLATSAMALGDVYVLQAASSELVRVAPRVLAALSFPGPALISAFTGQVDGSGVPPYLIAAAAKGSRAFPTFTYDPRAGDSWHERLWLEGDGRSDAVWPVHRLSYADGSLQRVTEEVAFTLADLAVCAPRRSRDLARVLPTAVPSGDLVPLGEWLDGGAAPSPTAVPYVNAVDADDRLVRLVVDDRLVRETRRTGDAWKRLVELATPPPAPVVIVRAQPAGEAEPSAIEAPAADSAAKSAAGAAAETVPERSSDEAYIDTVRCATCNECTNINPRMFAYNENKQAYIKDITAGTFRDLVEAAESCQVAIIHPGKPRDPSEPGLDELLERAASFA